MIMGGIFITPRQVESADKASFELVHVFPGWEWLNDITDFLSLGNILVSNRYLCQLCLGGFSSCIQYQEQTMA